MADINTDYSVENAEVLNRANNLYSARAHFEAALNLALAAGKEDLARDLEGKLDACTDEYINYVAATLGKNFVKPTDKNLEETRAGLLF